MRPPLLWAEGCPLGSMLPTRTLSGTRSTCAYLVLLRVEIARFTRTQSARLCCSDPHLGALQPFGGEVLPPTLSCAVRTFLQCGLSAHDSRKSCTMAFVQWLAPSHVC